MYIVRVPQFVTAAIDKILRAKKSTKSTKNIKQKTYANQTNIRLRTNIKQNIYKQLKFPCLKFLKIVSKILTFLDWQRIFFIHFDFGKIAQIRIIGDFISDGRVQRTRIERIPIELFKPRMFANHVGRLSKTRILRHQHPESSSWLVMQQATNKLSHVLREIARKANASANDFAVSLNGFVGDKRRKRRQHLINQNAHRPPIAAFAMSLSSHDLGA
mmetsp:Transcript_45428/g.75431  ORF Transcript_45428/g.75431 Transcript_45428/m.75431 type:complete len:216 (-) Transcript_45428:116-763(-)